MASTRCWWRELRVFFFLNSLVYMYPPVLFFLWLSIIIFPPLSAGLRRLFFLIMSGISRMVACIVGIFQAFDWVGIEL